MEPSQLKAPIPERRARIDRFDFRLFHPVLRFGTASDRYAAWIGQIYGEHWRTEITSRNRRLGGQTFVEEQLPVESVEEYFGHFSVLELDFTFYRPLLEPHGGASANLYALERYAEHAPPSARFLLKAPQTFFARVLRKGGKGTPSYEPNPSFLDAEAYTRLFHEPARRVLGHRFAGVLFEQEYQRVKESLPPEENIAELDRFFAEIPDEVQAHLELRSPHLLVPPYFAWLESRGLGFVFSHWTWLPPIRTQWQLAGGRLTARNREVVTRLLTPPNTRYEAAYAAAYPFDKPIPELAAADATRRMIDDATALAFRAVEQGYTLNVIANNRAYGNAPALAQAIAHRILDIEAQREEG